MNTDTRTRKVFYHLGKRFIGIALLFFILFCFQSGASSKGYASYIEKFQNRELKREDIPPCICTDSFIATTVHCFADSLYELWMSVYVGFRDAFPYDFATLIVLSLLTIVPMVLFLVVPHILTWLYAFGALQFLMLLGQGAGA